MTKLCASPISKSSYILFKNCLEDECFSEEQKKSNAVPVHKNGNKQLIKN